MRIVKKNQKMTETTMTTATTKKVFIALTVIAVALIAFSYLTVTANTQQKHSEVAYTPTELLTIANELRAEKGVKPLVIDERLNASAQWKADDMAKSNNFTHENNGYSGYQKAGELVPECTYASENIDGTDLNESPFENDGWVSSPKHYAAEIDPKYDLTGFGVVKANGYYTYVQHFCDLP